MKKRLGLFLLLGFIYLILDQYLFCPQFRFQPLQAFSGTGYYNPYKGIRFSTVQLANFHGHTRNWGGLTNGTGDGSMVQRRYDSLGYDLQNLSQYQSAERLDADSSLPKVYEHGYNINKTHQLVIGNHAVVWKDYFLPQTLAQKQDILNKLATDSDNIIVLNHPNLRYGYSPDDLKFLQNYDYIEGLHPHTVSLAQWDTALTYGHPVFLMGNDDFHDITKDKEIGNCLTVVLVSCKSGPALLTALRQGNTMAVKLNQPESAGLAARAAKIRRLRTILSDFRLLHDSLSITLNEEATIRWIGIHGLLKKKEAGKLGGYCFTASDTYIRVEIKTSDSLEIFMNPVFRTPVTGLASRTERSRQGVSTFSQQANASWTGKWFYLMACIAILWRGRFLPLRSGPSSRNAGAINGRYSSLLYKQDFE